MVATEVVDSLNAREKLGSAGLGQGVAIPHARVKGLAEPVAAFVRLKAPIAFGSPDGNPVSDCFVLLVPEQPTERHLQILVDIAQMLSKGQFRDRLVASRVRVTSINYLLRSARPDCRALIRGQALKRATRLARLVPYGHSLAPSAWAPA